MTEKNKVDFILEKYYKYLDKFLKSKDSYKILTQELSDKENQINESLNLLNNLEEDINLFNQYEKIFQLVMIMLLIFPILRSALDYVVSFILSGLDAVTFFVV